MGPFSFESGAIMTTNGCNVAGTVNVRLSPLSG